MANAHLTSAYPFPLETWIEKYGPNNIPTIQTEPRVPVALPDHEVERLEQSQEDHFFGFTIKELHELDCLPTRAINPNSLHNPIIPLLQRENWEVVPAQPDFTRDYLYELENGNGFWTMTNDTVWAVMQPILRLASRMLMAEHLIPWYDALFNGPRYPIPESRILLETEHNRRDLFSFHSHFSPDQLRVAAQRDAAFELLRTKYECQFGFMTSDDSPEGPDVDPTVAYGLTASNDWYFFHGTPRPNKVLRIFVFINLERVEHLLRPDLTAAEQKMTEWEVANTICHEINHAIATMRDFEVNRHDEDLWREPYFLDHCMVELGSAFEFNASFLPNPYHITPWGSNTAQANVGSTQSFLPISKMPLGFWQQTLFPDWSDVSCRDQRTPVLTFPGPSPFNEIYPITIHLYNDLQSDEFWNVAVRQFGQKVLQYMTSKQGARVQYIVTDLARNKFDECDPIRMEDFMEPKEMFLSLVEGLRMTPEQRANAILPPGNANVEPPDFFRSFFANLPNP